MEHRPVPAWARRPDVRVGAIVAVALAIGFLVWLLAIRDTSSNNSANGASSVSPDQLRALSVELGHPVYWAGRETDTTYELTRTSDGRVFVRYLPNGIPLGIPNPSFTIVGTYPVSGAYGVVRQLAKRPGEKSFAAPRGGFAVYAQSASTNVYVAYPNQNLQIEVYDPSPKRARDLVTSGRVAPVP